MNESSERRAQQQRFAHVPELGVTAPGLHDGWLRRTRDRPAGPPAGDDAERLRQELAAREENATRVAAYVKHLEAAVRLRDARVAALEAQLSRRERDLASVRALADERATQLAMSRYRLADHAHRWLQRVPAAHRALRWIARAVRVRRDAARARRA